MPDRVPEDMPDRMPEGTLDRMPDKMLDRIPEGMPSVLFNDEKPLLIANTNS